MKRSTGPLLLSILTVTAVFAGCSDDPAPQGNTGGSSGASTAGTSTAGATSGSTAGGTDTGGVAGSFSGSAGAGAGMAGTAGSAGAGGTGGAGAGNAGTAGTGGTPEPIVPTIVLIDNVRLQLKPGFTEGGGGEGGGTGVGGEGAGGMPDVGIGGMPDVGIGGEAAGGGGGEGGEGGPVDDPPWPAGELGLHGFLHTFNANVMPLAFNGNGFSPGPGGSEGPGIQNATTMMFEAAGGRPGGAVKVSVPFTVRRQQADISGSFPAATDLTHYELVAEVKLVSAGYGAECTSAWMYVYGGNGYANDKTGEPAQYTTGHLVEGAWKTVRLDLDGPYGYHSSATFTPALTQIWGIHLNTWGCP